MMSGTQQRLPTPGTRVADKVLQTFDYACVMGDYHSAAALLRVLEDMAERKARRFGGDRRAGGIDLGGARERLHRMKDSHPWEASSSIAPPGGG
jgi:hypothetical protein